MNETDMLVLKAQAGDADAETELLRRYSKLVKTVSFSYFVTCADIDREDLVQEGMIALMRAIRTYATGGEATFETYATRCVRNAMVDAIRHFSANCLPIDPEMEAPTDAQLTELAEAIATALSPAERQVLELRLEARTYSEIAKELGIQTKKVDNLIFSAKKKLKESLN